MAGIYIHIPFCKQACNYCDFHFSTSLQNKDAFLKALHKEIALQKNYLGTQKISTVYFGGGTPSLLEKDELLRIFDVIHKYFDVDPSAEITLEANPDDLKSKKIKELRDTPINRFSIGIQSFFDEDLKWMNRAHHAQEAVDAVKCVQDNGFENITIDLIYGIPTLTEHKWRNNLQIAFALGIKHISAYCLTVEPKTKLAYDIQAGKLKNVDEDQGADQFEIMLEAMQKNNFIQYEISNFCKEGFYSKHNSNYWLKEKYLGLGPSAHSYNGENRQWNISNNAEYIRSLEKGELNFELEKLSNEQRFNEYVLTSLRTIWGTDLKYIETQFGTDLLKHCVMEAEKYIGSAQLRDHENKLFLTDKGKLIADRIAGDLFKTE